MVRIFELVPALIALAFTCAAPTASASPVGTWLMQNGKAEVSITPCGDRLCGHVSRVVRYARDGARTDIHNADARLRTRPIVGLPVLLSFKREASRWTGQVYDPKSGRTFKAYLLQQEARYLAVKACVLIVCKTQVWSRVR